MQKLDKYNKKRDFSKTDEPIGKLKNSGNLLRFVVQHHFAKREHYDLRLEYGGVLISFALPKGPSLNPADKRLAIHVEDHPLGYENFEGTIPKGEYGGGTVMIWDEGFWAAEGDAAKGFDEGRLKIVLKGKRLKGKWFLTRLQSDGGKTENWLFIKEKDKFSNPDIDISDFNKSVKSGRTMREIEMEQTTQATKTKKIKKHQTVQNNKKELSAIVKNPFSLADIQLARLEKSLPSTGDWLYEMKYDGYRITAYVEDGSVRLLSRNGKDYAKEFKSIANSLAQHFEGRSAVIDGEIVIADEKGKTDFQALQSYLKNPQQLHQPIYVVFDLLARDGRDIREKPLISRKQALEEVMESAPSNLHLSKYVKSFSKDMLRNICDCGFEGIIAKKADSLYSGTRNGDWIKLKCVQRQEFVIGGYTRTQEKARGISSLLLGYFKEGKLVYAGSVGTGITEKQAVELEEKFLQFRRKSSPFQDYSVLQKDRNTVWLKAEFAAEIQFAEWTHDNLLRHPSFKGLREDKKTKKIVRENAPEIKSTKADLSKRNARTKPNEVRSEAFKSDKVKPKTEASKDKLFANDIKITSPDKLLFTNPQVTKSEVAEYYQKVAHRMFPLIENRLLSLVNCPKGVNQPCFYKKHIFEGSDGITVANVSNKTGKKEQYFFINAQSGIIEKVQMNAIEFHVWGSCADNLEKPNMMVFDLDPDQGMGLEKVRQGVRDLKSILSQLNLTAFLKTSGGKGYHLVVPFAPSSDWAEFRLFAKNIAELVVQKWPQRYTSNMRKENRKGKIFIDWMRNIRGATSIAPYSLRARNGAKVSMPISFSELDKVAPDGINMSAAIERLKRKDPWADFFKVSQTQQIK